MDLHSRTLRVWFAPYYHYLHHEPFHQVAEVLRRHGVDVRLLDLRGASGWDEYERYGEDTELGQRWEWEVIPIRRTRRRGLMGLLFRLNWFFSNRRAIGRLLDDEHPDVVVVGSDLGGTYIRALLDMAAARGIARVVVFTTAIGWNGTTEAPSVPSWSRLALSALGVWRNFSFVGGVPGSYDRGATVALPGLEYRDRLCEMGIDPERIVLTGNPLEDQPYRLGQLPQVAAQHLVEKALDLAAGTRIITCFTEVLQDVYGRQYLDQFYDGLLRVVASLPDDVVCIVKLHPKEPSNERKRLVSAVASERVKVVGVEVSTVTVLRASIAVLAHMSGVLHEALMMGIMPVVLGLANDDTRRFLPARFADLEVRTFADLEGRLALLLEGRPPMLQATLDAWRSYHSVATRGDAAERVASVILNSGLRGGDLTR